MGDWTFDGPKYHYVQALQWDVNADIDAIMDEFCSLSYGKAAEPMRAFWDRHETVWENRPSMPHGRKNTRLLFYQWPSWTLSSYVMPNHEFAAYRMADLEFFDQCIADAVELAAQDDEAVQFRVERIADAWRFVRTSVVSKLKFYDQPRVPAIASEQTLRQVLERAGELADLRAQRNLYLAKLKQYRHLNPNVYNERYWYMMSAMVLFSHEQTYLDDLCSAVSQHLVRSRGKEAARRYWQDIETTDSLHDSAQTQLYLLDNPDRPDRMVNGSFESGDLEGWEVSGQVNVTTAPTLAREGGFAAQMAGSTATLKQSLPVVPGERYRFTAWTRYQTQPPADSVPAEVLPQFFSGSTRMDSVEPLRHVARTLSPAAGWGKIAISMTAPLGADRVDISLTKRFNGTVLWDEVSFEKIQDIPRDEVDPKSDEPRERRDQPDQGRELIMPGVDS